MKKPTKKQIDDLAERLFKVAHPETCAAVGAEFWSQVMPLLRGAYCRVAEYVLTNYTEQAAKPKSCRLVDGKVVCK
jgi:hypothetical protein